MSAPRVDLTGRVFGKLTVLSRAHKNKWGKYHWLCQCECGGTSTPTRADLVRGRTITCGCSGRGGVFRYPNREHAARVNWFKKYRVIAKKRGLEWGITEELFMSLISGDCAYCGASPELRPSRWKHGIAFAGSGIDRVDNALGYTPSNVVPCCTRCNMAKRHHTFQEFLEHCRAIVSHFSQVPEVGI